MKKCNIIYMVCSNGHLGLAMEKNSSPLCFFETGSHYIAHAVLGLTRHTKNDSAALVSQVMGLKACTTFPASVIILTY